MEELITLLHQKSLSLVVKSTDGTIHEYTGRGMSDLLRVLTEKPEILRGALVADKVVGKGAAALMASGKIRLLYTDVISKPAIELLRKEGIEAIWDIETDGIINRAGTGPCPVEALTSHCETAAECLPLIKEFCRHQSNITDMQNLSNR